MPSECLLEVLNKSAVTDAVEVYRRAFRRGVRHRPTNWQRALIDTAAIAAVRFDQATRNPDISASDLSHLERVARNAKRDMEAALHPAEPEPEPPPAFQMEATGG